MAYQHEARDLRAAFDLAMAERPITAGDRTLLVKAYETLEARRQQMPGLDDYPSLKKAFEELTDEKEMILEESAPLHAEYDALEAQVGPLRAQQREIQAKIVAIERPRLGEIANELGAIARASGGRSTSQMPPLDLVEEIPAT